VTEQVVSYRRVSTVKQVTEGEGLEIQLERINNFCSFNNYTLISEFTDEGVSGAKDVVDRPGMLSLLEYCKNPKNKINYVIVDKVDRLSRDLYQQLFIEKELLIHNIKILYADQTTLNGESIVLDAMKKMMGVFAEMERKMINQRLADGMNKKAEGGSKPAGRQPFGYSYDSNRKGTIVNEAEAVTVRNIYTLRNKGFSLNHIASYLNISTTAEQRSKWCLTNRKRVWTNQSVRLILTNDYYIGLLRHGGKKIKGMHQSIVSEDVWRKVNTKYPGTYYKVT
jgi:site-specific DNA recombinase